MSTPAEFQRAPREQPPGDQMAAMADRWFGLIPALHQALIEAGIAKPTHIQALAIPLLLRGGSVALGSGTGTGKTLTYALPIVHLIKEEEARGVGTRSQHPRAIILLPTRELERQVLAVFKQLAHCAKVRVLGISGGSKQGLQRVALDSAVDVLVATPGRLSLLLAQGRLSLADVRHVVIDEVDTMMGDEHFAEELRAVLGPLRTANARTHHDDLKLGEVQAGAQAGAGASANGLNRKDSVSRRPPSSRRGFGSTQVVLAGATIPRGARDLVASAFPGLAFVSSGSLHLAPARVDQRFERVAGDPAAKHTALFSLIEELRVAGKLSASPGSSPVAPRQDERAASVLSVDAAGRVAGTPLRARGSASRPRSGSVMIFCNTISSARSTAHALAEAGVSLASLHGGIPPQLREREYAAFRDGHAPVLVCTDAAARGLDLPGVTHVVNFDFPLSPIDYLHRVGRTGRAGSAGTAISFVQRHDTVLATAIERAVEKRLPLDALSSSSDAYVHPKVLAGNARRREAASRVERTRGEQTAGARGAGTGSRQTTGSDSGLRSRHRPAGAASDMSGSMRTRSLPVTRTRPGRSASTNIRGSSSGKGFSSSGARPRARGPSAQRSSSKPVGARAPAGASGYSSGRRRS